MLRSKQVTNTVFLLLLFYAVFQQWYYYGKLPQRVAVHFNFQGTADGWVARQSLPLISLGTIVFLALLFWGISKLIRRVPDNLINLPNNAYWLASERREQTYRDIYLYLMLMANLTILFMLVLFQDLIRFNLSAGIHSLRFWPVVVFYILAISLLSLKMILRFSKTPSG